MSFSFDRSHPRHLVVALLFGLALSSMLGAGALAAGRVSPSDIGIGPDIDRTPRPGRPVLHLLDIENLDTSETFASIQDAINDADTDNGDIIQINAASHSEGLVTVSKSVTIQGMSGGSTILATTDTGTSGDARGWFLVTATGVTFKDLSFDGQSGSGRSIYQGVRFRASGGTVQNCSFANMTAFPMSSYDGRGIALFDASATITGCTFSNIRRIGIHIFGPLTAGTTVSGCTYTGKGDGDQLDYGIELGGGAVATLTGNTITSCTGVALVDGSTSAGILITDFFAPGTDGTVNNNFVTGNTVGVAVGYLATDVSVAVIQGNNLSGNPSGGVNNTNAARVVDASANWWGSNIAATVASSAGTAVDYTPWLDVGIDTSGSTGFQGDFSTLDVDDDSPQTGAVNRVQEGVDLVTASTVNLMPGTYEGQVVITTNGLTLDGAGPGSTIIQSPATLTASFNTGPDNYPVVFVNGATGVTVQDLTIDGLGRGNANYRFQGLAYWNGGGTARNLHITGIRETPLNGNQHGVGLYSFNNTGGPYTLEVDDCDIDDFQKNAMALSGTGMTVDVHDCTTTGAGPLSFQAQNGIQVSYGAGGTVTDCTISAVDYTPATWVASGLLTYQGTSVAASGIDLVAAQAPVSWYDTNGSMDDVSTTGGAQFGPIFVYNSTVSKAGLASREVRQVSPFEEDGSAQALGGSRTAASMSVTISNSCLTGTNATGTVGIYALSAGGPLSVDVANCIVADWDYGLLADGAATSLDASVNSITGNTTAGYDNSASLSPQDAEDNWWGAADGPSGLGPGSGDAVLGTGVDFTVWRTNGIDADPACGFQPSDNTVAPVPPGSCLSVTNTCVTVPFVITRADAVGMRAFSVTFQLSSELELCSGLSSVVEGSYLSSIGGTDFHVLDNGGGSYTVDCAILGIPCGATAASGTLFTVGVKRSGVDGTGTITPMFVDLRDCANGVVAGAPGSAATITIDTVPPVAVSNLAAAQVTSGNDADGTTKITLTFTAPGDAAVVEVYRAGFGNYPEYDDAPGAGGVPATPSYPPGAPWTPTGVTVTGQTDEVGTRDFWYFVMFTKDACGNVSAVSNQTGGTLNYHLGDTHNGVTDCVGNNLVNTSDITHLGANYGVTLVPSDPRGCLDVGPTTNMSVNARPTTDNRIQFEDLIMYAINFGTVSKQRRSPAPAERDELRVLAAGRVEPGGELVAHLWASGTGRVQGLSARLGWNPAVVELVGIAAGDLLESQGGVAFTPELGVVDAALLGVDERGLSGEGELATIRFRVIAEGDPGIELASVDARDASNRRIEVGVGGPVDGTDAAPRVTALLGNAPNPFNPTTQIAFSLAAAGEVELSIYDAAGRKVRTLVHESREAGVYEVEWNGTDDRGVRVSSGVYFTRLVAAELSRSRPVTLLK